LREIGDTGRIKQLIISGGEPFAVRGYLARVLAIAAERGMRALVNTSANWAVTEERAVAVLQGLPGLTHLAVSADEYHEPFVPLENVKHGLSAALRTGIVAELSIRVWSSEDPFLTRLYKALGSELLGEVFVNWGPIVPTGRGANLRLPLGLRPLVKGELPEGACDNAHLPIVDHDGQVLGCCNTLLGRRNKSL